ncbi:DUF3850 domain-containing protein [Candidatus Enterococcus murrayae]|uniref:DUF3850 domain-containing protein n=1 Tax=Candidatus Enterococcus murrayae TaxID=2815321 RepID=A0ABS3HF12_9ENTE|nr:DUF3850 domain-containing protein [Enterococcus sp. MJM16]MBO0451158.1 DUF3850 domain-containing protein [Enterococcus sp. MJM16]
MTHKLKISEEYYIAVENKEKKFEIRFNDRNFQVGDRILLQEITENKDYTGREISGVITYITKYEQKEGFVVFGFKQI